MIRFGIITVSTSCSISPEKDTAGPTLQSECKKEFPECEVVFRKIVTDDKAKIIEALEYALTWIPTIDVIFTVGGTGFAPSDVTPEATKCVIEKEAPGLTYAMLAGSMAITHMAMLSRPICGIKNKTLIVNFPGSSKAASECFGFVKSSLKHAVNLLRDEDKAVKKTHETIQISQKITEDIEEDSKVKVNAAASRNRTSAYRMVKVEEAEDMIQAVVKNIAEIETIPIERALKRTLVEDIRALKPIPEFPASIKDGYAVRAADGAGQKIVRAVSAAGDKPSDEELGPGEVVRISTGAPIPAGADAVVQVEDTTLVEITEDGKEEKLISINTPPKVGQDIRKIGSDIEYNTIVLYRYQILDAPSIGVLAMLGYTHVKVYKKPSIGVISTGNELKNISETLKPGQIYDSNKLTLINLLETHGFEASDCGIARDTPNSVKAAFAKAFEHNDFIISSGGVSMGEYDVLKQVLIEDFGAKIVFGRVNMKPGKPTVFATLRYKEKRKFVFALPGNPVSCSVTCLLFVIPALKSVGNTESLSKWPKIDVLLESSDIVNKDSRPEYVRANVKWDKNGNFLANTTGNQISSRLNSMVSSNALLLVPGNSQLPKGRSCRALLIGDFH